MGDYTGFAERKQSEIMNILQDRIDRKRIEAVYLAGFSHGVTFIDRIGISKDAAEMADEIMEQAEKVVNALLPAPAGCIQPE